MWARFHSSVLYTGRVFTAGVTRKRILSKGDNLHSITNTISHGFAIQHLKLAVTVGRWSVFLRIFFFFFLILPSPFFLVCF